jgi:hypothetical protein
MENCRGNTECGHHDPSSLVILDFVDDLKLIEQHLPSDIEGAMKTVLFVYGLIFSSLFIDFDASAQSIDWYKTHDKERNEKVEECKKLTSPRSKEDCRYAIDASVRSGSYTKSPEKRW